MACDSKSLCTFLSLSLPLSSSSLPLSYTFAHTRVLSRCCPYANSLVDDYSRIKTNAQTNHTPAVSRVANLVQPTLRRSQRLVLLNLSKMRDQPACFSLFIFWQMFSFLQGMQKRVSILCNGFHHLGVLFQIQLPKSCKVTAAKSTHTPYASHANIVCYVFALCGLQEMGEFKSVGLYICGSVI